MTDLPSRLAALLTELRTLSQEGQLAPQAKALLAEAEAEIRQAADQMATSPSDEAGDGANEPSLVVGDASTDVPSDDISRHQITESDLANGEGAVAAERSGPLGPEDDGTTASQIPPAMVTTSDAIDPPSPPLIGGAGSTGASDEEPTLMDRLRDAEIALEAEHPTLTGVMRRLIDVLGQMGI